MKKFYTSLVALMMLPSLSNAASNMAFSKTGRTNAFATTEERLIVSDRVINPNDAVKNTEINSGSYSVATWVNLDKYMSLDNLDNNMVIMSYTPSHHINTNGVWSVVVDTEGYLRVLGYGRYISSSVTTTQVPLNDWSHVAFVYNDDATTYSLYLNGELAGEWNAGEKFNWLDEHPVFNFAGWQFSGAMDEVQIYNKALTAEEVAAAQESATSVDGLAALYTLDELAEGSTSRFANLAEGGADYQLICQTITAKSTSQSYIWANGIPFVESSTESNTTYANVAETAPTLIEGREIVSTPVETYDMWISGVKGMVAVFSDAELTNQVAFDYFNEEGTETTFTSKDCENGLYIVTYPNENYTLKSLWINGFDYINQMVDNVFHIADVMTFPYFGDMGLQICATYEEVELSGIEEIGVDFNAADVEYFNLQGVRVAADQLTSGLYIARQGEKTMKVVIKK